MAKMAINSLLLALLLINGARALWTEDRPVLETRDGNLMISSAKDRNISLLTFGASSVNINDINLVEVSIAARSAARTVEQWEKQLMGGLTTEVNQISGDLNLLKQRLSNLDLLAGDGITNVSVTRPVRPLNGDRFATRAELVRLRGRVRTIEGSLSIIRTALRINSCAGTPCKNGGTCIRVFNGFQCLCPSNWEGPSCNNDVNECENYAGTDLGCQNGATCKNLAGSYRCTCANGWHGIHCNTKLNTCEAQDSTELCGHGTCVGTSTGFTCICDQGWESDGSDPGCRKDVNECTGKHPACSMNPVVPCINYDGGYRCGGCPAGYSGNGHYCSDVNECLTENGGCSTSPRVECINTIGSWSCGHCPAGYQGDGVTCTYVGVCRINNGGCSPLATCVESTGYVQCNCPPSYHGTGMGPQGCQPGTDLISPCSSNPCVHGTCRPRGASYVCQCSPQFTGELCDVAKNPCLPNPCQNGGICRSSDWRTVTCNCTSSFLGPRCENQRQSCSALFKNPSGTLEYPTDGMPYEHGLNCAFVISTNTSMVLNITFTRFDLEKSQNCRFDFLQIHDGQNAGAHQMGRFCGTDFPFGGSFMTTHYAVYLWLRTDSSEARRGFAIRWDSVAPACGGLLTSDHGRIASPGSPGRYPHNRDCEWRVSVRPGKRIQFHFFSVMLEEHPTCGYDYLEINETAGNRDVQLGLYCNHTHPAPLLTSAETAKLHFHSDGAGSDTGFQISYSTVEGIPGCGGIFTADEGVISSPGYPSKYPQRITCDWKIQLPRGEKIRLTWIAFDIEFHATCRYDAVQVFAGPDTDSPSSGRYCGRDLPASVVIESNTALIFFKSDLSNERPGFQLKYETVCGGKFEEPTGIIRSPYYPQDYPGSRTCIYEIIQEPGRSIVLSIEDMEIEGPIGKTCYFDYLNIYDGDNENTTLLGSLCGQPGNIPSSPYFSTTNYMYVKFVTDGSAHNRGFLANYTTIDRRCGGILKEPSGLIRSHVTGEKYSENEDCTWILKAPTGFIVQLSFTTFNLEADSRCIRDFVKIYDTTLGQTMGRFCGSTLPPVLTTQGESMIITFQSDFSISHEGFIAQYVFVDATKICGGHFFTTTGVITSPNYPSRYPPNKECVWIITAPLKQLVILEVNEFDIEGNWHSCNFDSLEIRNGGTELSPLIGKFCDTKIPRTIKSLTHEIYLKFTTDGSRQSGGFNISWDTSTYGCGGVLSGSRGEIISPGYPQPYGRLSNCLWTIAVAAGSKVNLIIVDLELEEHLRCRYDYIELAIGANEQRKPGTRYCNANHPPFITLDSNLVTIRFRSDYGNSGRGFHIRYETLCENTVRGFDGVIESPSFPEKYPNHANCTWIIVAPKGNKVNLTFSHFELEGTAANQNCTYDYVKISEGEENVENTDLGTFCGRDLPKRISSSTNEVFVHFRSDELVGHGGFRLEWIVVGCGGRLSKPVGELSSPGYPEAYPENIECEWLIDVDHGHSVEITFVDVSTEKFVECKFDKIELYAGSDKTGPKLAQFCHSDKPIKYTSPTNKLFVKFTSDFSYAGRGFKAQYKSVDLVCGGDFEAAEGVIHSANYPLNYPNNQNCEWKIRVDSNHLVNLTFSDFDIEDTTNCTDDYVKVFDGSSQDDVLLGKFCRNELPPSMISTGNTMLVVMRSDSLVTSKGFQAAFSKACGARIITEGTGTLETTSLLHLANEELNCTWTIIAKDPADHVTLSFIHMDLGHDYNQDSDCGTHYVQVYEGDGIDGPSRGKWCSNKAPASIVSNGYALTVHLVAYYGIIDDRFGATYSVLDSSCGGDHLSASGAFASPNYPENYIANATCIWLLRTSPGNRISLTFSEFELEESSNCDRDYLEIREDSGIGKLVGIFCTEVPGPIESSTKLWIKFRSDDVGTAKGFRADYTFLHGNELTGMNGEIASPLFPAPWKLSDEINWRITVDHGMAVRVVFDLVHIEKMYGSCLSKVMVYDGYDINAPILATVCGVYPPELSIISSSNVAYLQFTSEWVRDSNIFHLNWYQVPREMTARNEETQLSDCVVEYDLTTGHNDSILITSPGFPDGYADHLDCTWVVTTIPGFQLNIGFILMDLEETPNCINDYLTVFNGNGLTESLEGSQPLARLCRSNDTERTYVAKSVMTVKFHTDYYVNGSGFRAFVWRECGGELSGPDGIIDLNVTKQMYDGHVKNFRCEWNITVRQGKTIEVKFDDFKISTTDSERCQDNYVLLKNGAGPASPLLGAGKFCGDESPTDQLVTTSNHLYIKALGPWSRINFKMSWKEVGMDCGGSYRVGGGSISTHLRTPNYPNVPPPFSECFWTFMAPAGERLSLHFIERFDLTSSPNCTREYVEVRDGGTEHSVLLGRFCRDVAPSTITTAGNMLYVHYFSDVHDPKNGFKAAVTTGEVCGGILRGTTGVIRSPNYPATYPTNQLCGWWIDGPVDHTLKIEFSDLHLPTLRRCETGDYVTVGEKLPFNETVNSLGSYCGFRKPDLLETASNEAIVSFHSDNRTGANNRGFLLNYTASREACGGQLAGVAGEFKSTGYPNPMTRARLCEWTITVPEGSQAVLEVLDLDITDTASNTNYAMNFVVSNDITSRSLIQVVRQAPYPKKLYSTSRYMMIRLYNAPGHRGLRARFSAAAPVPCGGPVSDVKGTLFLPISPYNSSSFFCQWKLRAPESMMDSPNRTSATLTISISGILSSLSPQTSMCEFRSKFIRISDGEHLLGMFCGNLTGKTILLRSPALFTTLDLVNGTSGGLIDFEATYEWRACGGMLTGPSHTIRSPDELAYPKSCVWHAKFEDPGAVLRLTFNRMNLGSCDKGYIIIRNGGPLSPQVGKYCGNIKPGNITSSANQFWIEYWSSQAPGDFEIQLDMVSGSCGGSIRGANREILSPGFPTNYPNNAECIWDIVAAPGHSVGLIFVDRFNLETSNSCENDFVQIFDWTYDVKGIATWQEHPKLCGRNTPQIFNSTTNRMRVLFRSNGAIQGDGFKAIWEENCGGVFEATRRAQFIESPNYPDAYPNSKVCNWTITGPVGKEIWVEFLNFNVEGRPRNCKYDNVTIIDHRYYERERVFCGKQVPPTINSDQAITVIFKTDLYVSYSGFQLKFFVNECGGDITEPTELSPPMKKTGQYFSGLNCTWVITAPEGKRVVLRFSKFHLETSTSCSFDSVLVVDGPLLSGKRLARLCGNVSDPFPIPSVTNQMTVMFKSDTSNDFGGMRASVIFVNSIESGCGGTIDLQHSMPFRTQKTALYEDLQDCHWSITTEIGKNIRLTITSMDLKNKTKSSHPGCNGDYLEVRDGAGAFSELIGRYCGNSAVAPIESTTSSLWIRFFTDGSGTGEGVAATLEPIDSPCGVTLLHITNKTQIVTSPGYPGDYTVGIQCRWTFRLARSGPFSEFRVHFEEMDMEDSQDCAGDHIEISDEASKYISENFGENFVHNGRSSQLRRYGRYNRAGTYTYCGKLSPFDYYSSASEIKVSLKTTAQNLPKPRKFKYEVGKASCTHNYTAEQGRIRHEGGDECWFTITAKPNQTISVYFNHFQMYTSSHNCSTTFLKVHHGDFTAPVAESFCGSTDPNPIFSTINKLSFHSKGDDQRAYSREIYDILYTTTDRGRGCGGKIFNYGGTFTSPMYPMNYRNDSMCPWEISVPRGYQVALIFVFFDLGSSEMCGTDYMIVRELETNSPRNDHLCPGQTPATFISTTNVVQVRYYSSVNNGGTGWVIRFKAVRNGEDVEPYGRPYWRPPVW